MEKQSSGGWEAGWCPWCVENMWVTEKRITAWRHCCLKSTVQVEGVFMVGGLGCVVEVMQAVRWLHYHFTEAMSGRMNWSEVAVDSRVKETTVRSSGESMVAPGWRTRRRCMQERSRKWPVNTKLLLWFNQIRGLIYQPGNILLSSVKKCSVPSLSPPAHQCPGRTRDLGDFLPFIMNLNLGPGGRSSLCIHHSKQTHTVQMRPYCDI